MKRGLRHLVTAVAGVIAGWALVPFPLSAVFAPTRVTWDARTCPAGVYTVTSTARSLGADGTYDVTTPNVRLPRASFVQEFSNLPAGSYTVTARAQRRDGQTYGSDTQTITNIAGVGSSGHRRATPVEPAAAVLAPGARAAASTSSRAPDAQPTAPEPAASRAAPPGARGHVTAPRLAPAWGDRPLTIDELSRLIDATPGWRRFEAIDTDADGLIDLISIELANGDNWTWHLGGGHRSR